jgi:hypothetical protein
LTALRCSFRTTQMTTTCCSTSSPQRRSTSIRTRAGGQHRRPPWRISWRWWSRGPTWSALRAGQGTRRCPCAHLYHDSSIQMVLTLYVHRYITSHVSTNKKIRVLTLEYSHWLFCNVWNLRCVHHTSISEELYKNMFDGFNKSSNFWMFMHSSAANPAPRLIRLYNVSQLHQGNGMSVTM